MWKYEIAKPKILEIFEKLFNSVFSQIYTSAENNLKERMESFCSKQCLFCQIITRSGKNIRDTTIQHYPFSSKSLEDIG